LISDRLFGVHLKIRPSDFNSATLLQTLCSIFLLQKDNQSIIDIPIHVQTIYTLYTIRTAIVPILIFGILFGATCVEINCGNSEVIICVVKINYIFLSQTYKILHTVV
jgi:hypothetical protein